jgi:hypothetical protein
MWNSSKSIFSFFSHIQDGTITIPKVAPGSLPARFEIKKWNAVAMWSWDICADTVRFFVWEGDSMIFFVDVLILLGVPK